MENTNMRALVALARIIGRSHGLNVIFDRNVQTAATDGKTVRLPVISDLGTETHAVLIEGLLDHEAMHCHLTDFDALNALRGPAILFSLHNMFEDVWGEREQAKIYPGCARNIKKSMFVMMQLGWYKGPALNEHPAASIMNFLLIGLLARWYEIDALQTFAEQYMAKVQGLLGRTFTDRLWTKALEIDRVSSTQQAIHLAKEVLAMMEQENVVQKRSTASKRPGPLPSAPGRAGGGEGVEGENSGEPAGKGSDGQTVAQSNDPNLAPQPGASALGSVLSASQSEIGVTELADRIIGALSSEAKAGRKADAVVHALVNGQTFGPTVFPIVKPTVLTESNMTSDDRTALRISRPISAKLGSKLESLLETRIDCTISARRSGTRILSGKVAAMRFGRLQVFERRDEGQGIDTSVAILLDKSGSMDLELLSNAEGTAVAQTTVSRRMASAGIVHAAAYALAKHDVPFAVYGFGSSFCELKSFETPWKLAKHHRLTEDLRFTATDFAVLEVTSRMIRRPEARKLMILVTDGAPDRPLETVAAMNEARLYGLQFAVVFIGDLDGPYLGLLRNAGYKVAHANCQEELSAAFFKAIENAF